MQQVMGGRFLVQIISKKTCFWREKQRRKGPLLNLGTAFYEARERYPGRTHDGGRFFQEFAGTGHRPKGVRRIAVLSGQFFFEAPISESRAASRLGSKNGRLARQNKAGRLRKG